MTEEAEKIEVVPLPLEQSVGGKNRHVMWCDPYEQRRFYGSCARLVEAHFAGRLKTEDDVAPDEQCSYHMERGNCPAIKMRKEEIAAGHALYYVPPRINGETVSKGQVNRNSPSYLRGYNSVGGIKKPFSEPMPANYKGAKPGKKPVVSSKSQETSIGGDSYADLVTEMAKDERATAGMKPGEMTVMVAGSTGKSQLVEKAQSPVTKSTNNQPIKAKPGESMLELARRMAEQKRGEQQCE